MVDLGEGEFARSIENSPPICHVAFANVCRQKSRSPRTLHTVVSCYAYATYVHRMLGYLITAKRDNRPRCDRHCRFRSGVDREKYTVQ